jgi:dodecin
VARVVKIVELMGVSQESFSDAVRQAVKEAAQSIRNITGVEVIKSTAQVEGDEIIEYHVTVRLAFGVERGESAGDEEQAAGTEEDQRGEEGEQSEEDEQSKDEEERNREGSDAA